jgi:hypothetical protein
MWGPPSILDTHVPLSLVLLGFQGALGTQWDPAEEERAFGVFSQE